MITAMPTVKPSMTGHGRYARSRPTRASDATTTSDAGHQTDEQDGVAPYRETIGTSTTVIAPVGPDTCTFEPPKTAATTPATIAVIKPAVAPRPLVIPKASASGSATTPTVTPATTSPRHVCRNPA